MIWQCVFFFLRDAFCDADAVPFFDPYQIKSMPGAALLSHQWEPALI